MSRSPPSALISLLSSLISHLSHGKTLSFLNRYVKAIRPTNRDSLAPVTCPRLCTKCTPPSALTVTRGGDSCAARASRTVRCTTPARNVDVVSYAATGGYGSRKSPAPCRTSVASGDSNTPGPAYQPPRTVS